MRRRGLKRWPGVGEAEEEEEEEEDAADLAENGRVRLALLGCCCCCCCCCGLECQCLLPPPLALEAVAWPLPFGLGPSSPLRGRRRPTLLLP